MSEKWKRAWRRERSQRECRMLVLQMEKRTSEFAFNWWENSSSVHRKSSIERRRLKIKIYSSFSRYIFFLLSINVVYKEANLLKKGDPFRISTQVELFLKKRKKYFQVLTLWNVSLKKNFILLLYLNDFKMLFSPKFLNFGVIYS